MHSPGSKSAKFSPRDAASCLALEVHRRDSHSEVSAKAGEFAIWFPDPEPGRNQRTVPHVEAKVLVGWASEVSWCVYHLFLSFEVVAGELGPRLSLDREA